MTISIVYEMTFPIRSQQRLRASGTAKSPKHIRDAFFPTSTKSEKFSRLFSFRDCSPLREVPGEFRGVPLDPRSTLPEAQVRDAGLRQFQKRCEAPLRLRKAPKKEKAMNLCLPLQPPCRFFY